MNRRNRSRAFADGGGDPLVVTAAHVTDGEYTWECRLQREGTARQRPTSRREILWRQRGSGLDEAGHVECQTAFEPAGARHRARHGEDVTNFVRFDLPGPIVAPMHALEMAISFQRADLRVRSHNDSAVALDATDEIPRHALGETSRANQQVNLPRRLRQEHCRLA